MKANKAYLYSANIINVETFETYRGRYENAAHLTNVFLNQLFVPNILSSADKALSKAEDAS